MMKALYTFLPLSVLLVLVSSEIPVSKAPLVFHNWPPKHGKQVAAARHPNLNLNSGKQRTLVVQIRSDQPVPLVLGGRPNHLHSYGQLHHAHVHAHAPNHLRSSRPAKLSAPIYLKNSPNLPKPILRKPLKIKLSNTKPKSKPAAAYEKPFKYEKPAIISFSQLGGESHKLPLDTHVNFISEHFAPIHTVPAPNLAIQDNHIHQVETYLPPTLTPNSQPYHQSQSFKNHNQYQVVEDNTNDHTILDPFSGSQKLFAPDPDPSLPTSKIRPATESFNQPSNNKPLPIDVAHSNYRPPAQPLVQIVGAQQVEQSAPEIYPIQFTQQAQLQPFVTANIAAVQAAPIPIYNPTYLVTQSNNLYTHHRQQLFKPHEDIIETGYVNADLTQQVASNGQILQSAKDPHNNIHPVLDTAPQFAALIAAPVLNEEQSFEPASFHLPNVAVSSTGPEEGFIVSNYYSHPQDSSQLLQAYAEEEAQLQQQEAEQVSLALQAQQQQIAHQHQQHLQQQQHQQHLEQQQQQQHLQQQQQQHLQQQQQQHLQQQQQQHLQQQQQQHLQQLQQDEQHLLLQQQHNHLLELQENLHQQHQQVDPAAAAFEEHQRLVQQQLGDTPLRIFVPDEEAGLDGARIQKRSENLKKGTVQDVNASSKADGDSFEVSSSVEVSSENQRDTSTSSEASSI